ncbi:MAG: hypothetical protein ACU0BK_03645 [Shimia sp.]|uniref:hypothetical protein n=1 Tax=Shimia sp. TaxID=1954381 RepID=UPI004057D5F2
MGTSLGQIALETILSNPTAFKVEETGAGYLLTVCHRDLPLARHVFSQPLLTARIGEVLVGFIVIIQDHELTLECFGYGDEDLPKFLRGAQFQLLPW